MVPEQGRQLLSKIQAVDGCASAVIAGGYVRDHLLGKPFKDIDVFFPCNKLSDLNKKVKNLKASGVFEEVGPYVENGYKEISPNYLGLYSASYQGVTVELIGYFIPDDEDFVNTLIDEFNYYIDKVAWDGDQLVISHKHNFDVEHKSLTLCHMQSTDSLPKSLRKFERLHEKYPDYSFNTTLELVEPKKSFAKLHPWEVYAHPTGIQGLVPATSAYQLAPYDPFTTAANGQLTDYNVDYDNVDLGPWTGGVTNVDTAVDTTIATTYEDGQWISPEEGD